MKTIKSKIMDIYKEIGEDNSRDFSKRKYLKEYLGSVLINYRRKSDKKIVMKIYKSKSKKGTEIFIDNTVYFLTMVENIMVIYNEYGRAVSISFTDGYEWTGETFISEDAIIEENSFRLKYQKFIKETENSKDLKKLYNDSKNMLALLNNTTFVCDTTKMYENIYNIYSYLDYCLHNNMDTYFNSKLDKVKDINKSLENYYQKEDEVEYALKALNDYYLWLIDIENLNRNRLNSQDKFFKIVNEMKEHINKLFNKMTISQSDWDLLDYYHEEIEKLISNKEIIKEKQPMEVTIEYVDLNDDENENLKVKPKKRFRKTTVEEKADYLTFKTLRKFGTEDYQFNAENISVKNAKKELKKFNKTQEKYEKLINKDYNNEVDDVSYAVYNTVKEAKEDLLNTGIEEEKSSKEIFNNSLRNNNDRSVYLKRQEDLRKSASKISKIKNILGSISDESFDKIKENYRKVKRRLIGLGAGICAGALAITSFGAGAYKNYQKNLNNNSLVYESDDISIYGDDSQKVEAEVSFETNIEGFGTKNKTVLNPTLETNLVGIGTETETEANTETEKLETNVAGFGAKLSETEVKKSKTAMTETEAKETEMETPVETETEVKETEKLETNLVGIGTETETDTEAYTETEKLETNIVGFGAKLSETEVKETETETPVETETEVRETETETPIETEREVRETETENIPVETELSTESILETQGLEEVSIEPSEGFEILSIEVVPNETRTEYNVVETETEVKETETETVETKLAETEANTSTTLKEIEDEKDLLNTYKNELQNLEALLPQSEISIPNVRNIGDVVNVSSDANLQNDEYSLIKNKEGHQSIHKDNLPRVISRVIMSDGNSGITAKTMEEVESLINQGYYVAGYGVLNPYSSDANNIEGFFESEDVYTLVRK